jgi:hypothetical protein
VRTTTPGPIRDDFLQALTDVETTYAAADGSTMTAASKKLVAEYSVVAAAALWEGYLSDLFVAYLNQDSSQFVAHLTPLISLSATDDIAKRAIPHASVKLKTHFTVADLRGVLDSRDYNITFPSPAKLKEAAGKYLALAHRGYFTGLTPGQCATIEGWRTTRNFVAHRSKSSKTEMQAALAVAALPAWFKRGTNKVHDVGSFMTAAPTPNQSVRLVRLLAEMKAIGRAVCP